MGEVLGREVEGPAVSDVVGDFEQKKKLSAELNDKICEKFNTVVVL